MGLGDIKNRVTDWLAAARKRMPVLDRVLRMQSHYSAVGASQQAGAITYFGFLSIFPVLALAFFAVGRIAYVYPDAQHDLITAINHVLPGLVGGGDGQVPIHDIEQAAGAIGIIGAVGLLYAGLGWVDSLRTALILVFEVPKEKQPGFVKAKLTDLVALVVIGVVLLVSVVITSLVRTFSLDLLRWMHLSSSMSWLVWLITLVIGLAANGLLFFSMFQLARPRVRVRPLIVGALIGAVGFEVLKQASTYLLAATRGQPAFQVFGIALIMLVWINYFTRVILYAASFALVLHKAPLVGKHRHEPADPEPAASAAEAAEEVTPPRSGSSRRAG
ncbi:MAG: YihY/virulence factor BrkB family protein [Nocardioides sp.]|nr:YihY/virulence factor BrkB family protein [Nocardioides sp.]